MSVLVFAELIDGSIGKPTKEALTYGYETSKLLGTNMVAVCVGNVPTEATEVVAKYGAEKIIVINNNELESFNAGLYAEVISQAVTQNGVNTLIFSSTFNGKTLASRLSAKLKAGLVTNAVSLPDVSNGFTVKKSVFSGKGFGYFVVKSPIRIITVSINSFKVAENNAPINIDNLSVTLSSATQNYKVTHVTRSKGKISLPEADIVISGGRGLKGPENWHLVEDMAELVGAATACSKPVSDIGWRPHSEHVGQTGITISPNLYVAIGISGAIQHLAGVSSSKVIVAINKDPEAPFFKAADYGIVGDAFEVMPKLISAIRKIKAH